MSGENRNILKQRIGPGIWIDADGVPHISVEELLELFEFEDTPENRRAVTHTVLKAIRGGCPDSKIIFRATPEE